jgi:hypothetical protein
MAAGQDYRCMDSVSTSEHVEHSRLLGRGEVAAAANDDLRSEITAAAPPAANASGVEMISSGMGEPLARGGDVDLEDQESEGGDVDLFAQVDSLIKPVSATMLMVVALVGVLNTSPVSGTFSNMMVYDEQEEDSTSTKVVGSLENALIFIALIVGVTTALFLLYKFHCTKLIYAWLMTSVGMLLASFGGLVS